MRLLAFALLLPGCLGLDQYQYDDEQGVVVDSAKPEAFGALVLSRTALNFGELDVGASASETVLLSNEGEETIELLNVELATGADFHILTTLVGDIDPGAEQALDIVFSPGTAGAAQDALIIETNAPGAEYVEVTLTGSGADDGGGGGDDSAEPRPNVRITPQTYSFGNVDIGDVGTQPFTIENTGSADLIVNNLVGSASAWSWDRSFSLPAIIEPGQSRSGNLTFTPNAEGQTSGTVTLQTNDPDTPEIPLNVSGIGVQGCTTCGPRMVVLNGSTITTALTIYMLARDGTGTERITIQNEGDENLVVSGIHVENDTTVTTGTFLANGYGSLPLVLAPWSSQTVDVTLRWSDSSSSGLEFYTAPTGWIPEQNYLRISSNDAASPEYTIQLSAVVF